MKQFSRLFALLVLAFLAGPFARATTVTPYAYTVTAPSYTGSVFDDLTSTLVDGALFFGVVAVIAVLIVGFRKGKAWLGRV